ncbi:MAG: TatD family hydrolase [Cytophagaceae bacterium]|nr:TatD family hydrolase [Gemmatimonadaceae bacterium]
MPSFIDSHTHLADPAFDEDREAVIARAREAGALALVSIGESLGAADRSEAIATAHPGFVAWTAGVHPSEAATYDPQHDPARLRAHIARGAVAVGECGLDGTYDHAPLPLQRRAFAEQLVIARDTGRPVVVHTRQAVDDTMAMVREAGQAGVRGILHCFTGPLALAEVGIAAGWYISFSGVITFKRWADDDLIRLVPSDRLLVETDAPYLAPVPFRGKRNEPAHIVRTLGAVARARGMDVEEMGRVTSRNAAVCFGLAVTVP